MVQLSGFKFLSYVVFILLNDLLINMTLFLL